jgi:hypothetical protein
LSESDEKLPGLHRLAAREAEKKSHAFTAAWSGQPAQKRREFLAEAWRQRLGNVKPYAIQTATKRGEQLLGKVTTEHWYLQGEGGIPLPAILLVPQTSMRHQVLVAFAQEGKAGLLKHRAALLAELSERMLICLVDLRGTGETSPEDERGRRSSATSLAASGLMLGETLTGAQLRDLRSVLAWLRKRPDVDASRLVVYGDSFAPPNAPEANVNVPLDAAQPNLAEPASAALALLAGLFEPDLAGVVARGGMFEYASIFGSPFIHIPFDAIVPGAATCGDLPLVAKTIAGRPLWLSEMVDGHNRRIAANEIDKRYGEALRPWHSGPAGAEPDDAELARWLSF